MSDDPVQHTDCVFDSVNAQKVCVEHRCVSVMRRIVARKVLTSVESGTRKFCLLRWQCGNQTRVTAGQSARAEEERLCESENLSKKGKNWDNLLRGIVSVENASLDFLTIKSGVILV